MHAPVRQSGPRVPDELRQKIDNAPKSPGCYIFRDAYGNVIYVGKSKQLSTRVRQYFQKSAQDDERIAKLIREIADVEFLTVATELDALIEEYGLIKKHRPWFNAQHKQDVRHPYIRIDMDAAYPSISVATDQTEDGAAYFGMFQDAFDAKDAIDLLNRAWQTPMCGKPDLSQPTRPCLFYGMRRCVAPCDRKAERTEYRARILDIAKLLSGQEPAIFTALSGTVREHAMNLRFEMAQETQRIIGLLERLRRRCHHRFRIKEDTDAFVFLRVHGGSAMAAFFVKGGNVRCRGDFSGGAGETEALAFLGECERSGAVPGGEPWLPGCLMEVYTKKKFVPLERERTKSSAEETFLRAFFAFQREGRT